MKIVNQDTIQESEKEFIDTINAELNWESIEKLLYEKFGLAIRDEVDYRNGGLVVYKEKVAYTFTFDVKVPLSIVFDSKGECLDLSSPLPEEEEGTDSSADQNGIHDQDRPDGFAEKASELAGVIDEINQGMNNE